MYSMTWLKKRIQSLGLHRKGVRVQYSPFPQVQAAIEVGTNSVINFIS